VLHLILGGAAVYRCDNCFVLNPALAAEVAILGRKRLFPQPASPEAGKFHAQLHRELVSWFAVPERG
jgi:hypothetical protein